MTNRRKAALFEMSKRGTEAEKKIALAMIEEQGIVLEEKERKSFAYRSAAEKDLIFQIYAMICDTTEVNYCTYRTKNAIGFMLTAQQIAEFELCYSIYRRELKAELELTYQAFIQRNSITPQTAADREHTDEEWAEIAKVLSRAETMDKTHVRKAIK